jgi:hypothetical protein
VNVRSGSWPSAGVKIYFRIYSSRTFIPVARLLTASVAGTAARRSYCYRAPHPHERKARWICLSPRPRACSLLLQMRLGPIKSPLRRFCPPAAIDVRTAANVAPANRTVLLVDKNAVIDVSSLPGQLLIRPAPRNCRFKRSVGSVRPVLTRRSIPLSGGQ